MGRMEASRKQQQSLTPKDWMLLNSPAGFGQSRSCGGRRAGGQGEGKMEGCDLLHASFITSSICPFLVLAPGRPQEALACEDERRRHVHTHFGEQKCSINTKSLARFLAEFVSETSLMLRRLEMPVLLRLRDPFVI